MTSALRYLRNLHLAVFAAAVSVVPHNALAEQITVFAAASLRSALEAASDQFEQRSGQEVTVSYAGSSTLSRQIGLGAPADIFISANALWMDRLEAIDALEAGTRKDLLSNQLVLIAHGLRIAMVIDAEKDLGPILSEGRLAMALVDAVPAGLYGKAALQNIGLWDQVRERVVQTDNVRAALRLVAIGEAPWGIVYQTDVLAEPRVSTVTTFPAHTHPEIIYPMAILNGRSRPAVEDFANYLESGDAAEIFRDHGFIKPRVSQK